MYPKMVPMKKKCCPAKASPPTATEKKGFQCAKVVEQEKTISIWFRHNRNDPQN